MKKVLRCGTALLLAVLMMLMFGCTSGETVPDPVATMEAEDFPLSPEVPTSAQYLFTLYFGLADESYLASEARYVTVTGSSPESALVNELIKGPSTANSQLIGVINPKTKLIGIERSGDYLYVTLSREFLDPVLPVTEESMTEERQKELKLRMLKLGAYSVVNTLTELGSCTRVQILIDTDNTGEGIRPTRSVMGLAAADAEDADTLVSPLARQEEIILNPDNTVENVMKAFMEKNWDRVEKFCAMNDAATGGIRADKDAFINELTLSSIEILSYDVKSCHVSVDGQMAVVLVDAQMRSRSGSSVNASDIPVRLIRENGIWKLSYTSVAVLLKAAG